MATLSNGDHKAALAAKLRELNSQIDVGSALIEPHETRTVTVEEDDEVVTLDLFRVTLSNGEVHDELTDLEALDLAKWWCALPVDGV